MIIVDYSPRVGNGEIKATCEIGTQTCELFQQGTERQGYDAQCSWVDLSTEIEGLKLDIVIAESKAAGNFQSNKQAIDKLRNELNTIKGENQLEYLIMQIQIRMKTMVFYKISHVCNLKQKNKTV